MKCGATPTLHYSTTPLLLRLRGRLFGSRGFFGGWFFFGLPGVTLGKDHDTEPLEKLGPVFKARRQTVLNAAVHSSNTFMASLRSTVDCRAVSFALSCSPLAVSAFFADWDKKKELLENQFGPLEVKEMGFKEI